MAGPLDNALSILGGGQDAPAPTPAARSNAAALNFLNDPKNRSAIMADADRIAAMRPGAAAAPTATSPAQSDGPLSGALAILSGTGQPAAAAKQAPASPSINKMPTPLGMAEFGLHAASGLAGQIAGGLAGILSGGDADVVHKVSDAVTYEPRTDAGKAAVEGVRQGMGMVLSAPGIRNIVGAYDSIADKAGAVSPAAGAAVRTLPTAVGLIAAPEVRSAFSSGMRPLRDIGRAVETPARIEPTMEKPRIKLNVDGTSTPVSPQPGMQPSNSIAPPTPDPQILRPNVTAPQRQPVPATGAPARTGAAGADAQNLPAGLSNASPELQQKVSQLVRQGKTINQDVLARHVDAESLPVPLKLTEGQATLNPDLISTEMNGRGKAQPAVSPDFYNQQGKALAANLDAIRSKVAPDIASLHPTEAGQTLIDRYKMMDEPIVQDINAKYQALRDANGGQFPVDAGQLLTNVRTALRKELLSNDAPTSQMHELERLATDGNMTFEDFLSLRRNLGNVARTATDGNTRTAAGIMARQLEELPLSSEAAALKPLADQARAAARARFEKLDADPAYKATINDGVAVGEPSPLADKFVNSYITGANARLANLKQMRGNLGNDPVATQTIAASTIDHLQQAAKADAETGKFMADMYGKNIKSLAPKLEDLVGPEAAQQLQQVGRVAKYTSAQPRGSYVNNSGTLVGALSDMGKAGLSTAAAVKTMGASKVIEKGVEAYKANSAAKRATSAGAGIAIKDLLK